MSDLPTSLAFYKQLGFKPVTASRGGEVTMVRNANGDELNLVRTVPSSNLQKTNRSGSVAFQMSDLREVQNSVENWYGPVVKIDDTVSQRFRLLDPDENAVEFFELTRSEKRTTSAIYLIVTQAELQAGLSEHYFQPPTGEHRFVRAHHGSAFLEMAMNRVALEASTVPCVVTLDEDKLSTDEPLVSEQSFDSKSTSSAYPLVYAPIDRHALLEFGACEQTDEGYGWPSQFEQIHGISNQRS